MAIARYPGDPGVYLLYLDDRGEELTDTYHDTIEAAMEQAVLEFELRPEELIPGAVNADPKDSGQE